MPKIFISYRRADSQYVTDSIYEYLVQQFGQDHVFLDVDNIPFGVDFRQYLYDQTQAHDAVLVIIGPEWARAMRERAEQPNDFVRIEIENALQLKKLVIPVLVMNAEMPDFRDLPASIQDLQWRNSAVVRRQPDLKNDCLKLAEGIRQFFVTNSVSAPSVSVVDPVKHHPSHVPDILPVPFSWIDVPSGKVELTEGGYVARGKLTVDVPAFTIAKYPITNAQYGRFIDAQGYDHPQWWTPTGWEVRQNENWTEPRRWREEAWNQPDYPVVCLSWYEAAAFCLWLSAVSGEKIVLPTEQQWQRAAQGDDERAYPWGVNWDHKRCNHNVGGGVRESGLSTVTQYEGSQKGDSPYGVVDMAGNVWEWCLTAYETGEADWDGAHVRVLRGGSWRNSSPGSFRTIFRNWNEPQIWDIRVGFRIARL